MWALSVAVTSTILGTSLVVWETRLSSILVHLDEVESTVETARKLGDIDIEGELLVQELEHVVLVGAGHEVDTGTDVGTILMLGNKLQAQAVSGGGDTVGLRVLDTLNSTVLGASLTRGADGGIPLVSVVAVLVVSDLVGPSPVGVERDLGLDSGAARLCASLDWEGGVGLSIVLTDLLSGNLDGTEGEGEERRELELHFED